MNHQPYNAFIKNLARQVVDIDEANPRLSKFLKLSHFLITSRYRASPMLYTNSFIHQPPALQRIYQKSGSTSCRYRRGESDAIKNFEIIPLFDAKTCT